MWGLSRVLVLLCVALASADDLVWWKTTNFYQVYPRSFKDSDGDGIGDLKGIAQMADHFNYIGVDAIWLSPFQPSPMVDFGYDISNFTGVDPIFGTMDDFINLQKTVEKLGIKLVVDFVPNHTSDQHPWFQLSSNRTEPYTDFFIWDNGTTDDAGNHYPPNNWMSVFGGSAWEWHEGRQQFYFHDFTIHQIDLNYNNPLVVQRMEEALNFWLDLGVDGFRVDSVNYIFESDDLYVNESKIDGTDGTEWKDYIHNLTQNLPKTYKLMERWGQLIYNYSIKPGSKPRAMFLEVYTDLNHTIEYYGKGDTSMVQPFNFELLMYGNQSLRAPGFKKIIDEWLIAMPEGDVANWVIGNHDNGRVTDRLGFELIDGLNLMTGVLPGIKVTYYGSEIAMRDTFVRWDQTVDPSGRHLGPFKYIDGSRDPSRTPMQWDDSPNSGFSTAAKTWLPVNPNYWWLNVEAQKKAEKSHLKVFQALSKARKDPVLQRGDTTVRTPNNDTLLIIRSYNGSFFALIINTGSEIQNYTSTNTFAPNNLDIDMQVVITSIGISEHNVGDILKSKSLQVILRPKASILLKSTSAASRLLLSLPLLFIAVLKTFWR